MSQKRPFMRQVTAPKEMKGTLLFLLLFSMLITVSTSIGQDAESLKVFEAIPAKERPRLSERLKTYLEYQRTKQWSQLFDMFPKVNTQHPEITKEQFLAEIKKYGKRHVIDFVPEEAFQNESIEGKYAIRGCVKVKDGWSKNKWQGTIFVSLEKDEWVLSDVYFAFQMHVREPMPCSTNKK